MGLHAADRSYGRFPETVEAWEAGTNVPLGTARRMLGLMQSDNSIPVKYKIVG
ncbi:MAG: hypothetical protein ACI4JZ_04775 [Oscillospiraceae bacterium]